VFSDIFLFVVAVGGFVSVCLSACLPACLPAGMGEVGRGGKNKGDDV